MFRTGSPAEELGVMVRAWGAIALLSVPLAALATPDGTVFSLAYLTSVLLSTVFVTVAVLAVPRDRRRPWLGMLAMMHLSLVGEIWFTVLDLRGIEEWPSGADVVYISAYVALAVGVRDLERQRNQRRPPLGGLLDAGIVTTAVAVLALVFLIGPLITDSSQSLATKIVGSLYPLMDVMLAYLVARMLIGSGRRVVVVWWIVAAMIVTLIVDTAQNIMVLTSDVDDFPRWMEAAWLLFYPLIGYAAVSARDEPSAPKTQDVDTGLTVPRLCALGLAGGLPAAVQVTLAFHGSASDSIYLGIGTLVLMAMVVTRIWDLLQQLRRQADQLELMARSDPLTGVANRRSWDFDLARAMATAQQTGTVLVIGLLDLDHFKKYNDTHGHQAGDDLLCEAARAWSVGVGARGRIARWGGEEFAVAVDCDDVWDGVAVLDGLRGLVPFGQTCSIGAARWDGSEDATAVLHRADTALYEAKESGRDRLVLASAEKADL